MFDFLTALFGGIFYYGEISSEKAINRAREQEHRERMERHKNVSLTEEEQSELSNALFYNEDAEVRKVLLESISDELEEVYGDNWRDNYYPLGGHKWHDSGVREPWGVAFHILASKKYKLPMFLSSSYELGFGLSDSRRQEAIRACKVIERNMQKRYPELRLWWVPRCIPNSKPLQYFEELGGGSLVWEHMLSKLNKKYNPPIKRLW